MQAGHNQGVWGAGDLWVDAEGQQRRRIVAQWDASAQTAAATKHSSPSGGLLSRFARAGFLELRHV